MFSCINMGLNDCPHLNWLRLNNIPLHRSKPFIKNVIMKLLFLSPFKNCSKTLGLSQLVSTRVSIKVHRYHQNKPRQERRYREINVILVHNVQACHKIKMNTQVIPTTPKPSQADTNQ